MKTYLPFLICLMSFSAHAGCLGPPADAEVSSHTLRLSGRASERAFYLRAQQYAILVDRKELMSRLERRAKERGPLSDGRLLNEIRGSGGVAEYVDLFSFVLKDPFYLERIELLLSDMLESGAATVVDALSFPEDKARIVSEIVMYKVKAGGAYSARRFCTLSGDLLLEVTDSVA